MNFTISFQLKKNKAHKDKKVPIYLRITVNGERIEVSIRRKIEPDKWDSSAQKMKGRSEDARVFNNYLENITTKIYRHYNQLSDAGAEISALLLKEYNEGKNDPKQYLIEAFHLNNQLMEKEKGSKYTSDTIKQYRISIERLKSFIQNEYGSTDVKNAINVPAANYFTVVLIIYNFYLIQS